MAKKKSRIKDVVETVEGWVGMGRKAKNKIAKKSAAPKKKVVKKKMRKRSKAERDYDR